MKKLSLVTVFALVILSSFGQRLTPIPFTQYRELINKRYYKETTKGLFIPVFPAALQAMQNREIELPGYMIPLKTARTHSRFMLSVLPLSQCEFCGGDGIPNMVEVNLKNAIEYDRLPIKVKGKLVLNIREDDSVSEVVLVDAEHVVE